MISCYNCQTSVSERALFCHSCGLRMPASYGTHLPHTMFKAHTMFKQTWFNNPSACSHACGHQCPRRRELVRSPSCCMRSKDTRPPFKVFEGGSRIAQGTIRKLSALTCRDVRFLREWERVRPEPHDRQGGTHGLSSSDSKPTGVDLLVILAMIGGIIDILCVALFLVVTSVSLSWLGIFVRPGIVRLVFLVLSTLSFLFLIFGVSSFFLAYGLWKGRGWAWAWALSSAIIGFAASILALVVGIGLIGVASNALTVYYLTRTEVKVFFGKAPIPESKNFSRLPSMVEMFCGHCGNRLNEKEAYCPNCGSKR